MARNAVKEVKNNKKKYKINYFRIAFILFAIYFVFSFVKQQLKLNEYNIQIGHIEDTIQTVNKKTEELNESKDKLNDAEYIEQVAREKLGLVKPYEKVFIDVNK